jgi:hypothetical protein
MLFSDRLFRVHSLFAGNPRVVAALQPWAECSQRLRRYGRKVGFPATLWNAAPVPDAPAVAGRALQRVSRMSRQVVGPDRDCLYFRTLHGRDAIVLSFPLELTLST